MSKRDNRFLSMFEVVLGMLVGIGFTIALTVFARSTGRPAEQGAAAPDAQVAEQTTERIAPVGRVAVAGTDNTAIAIVPTTAAGASATAAVALPKNAEDAYQAVCSACHGAGLAGAPKMGDRGAWKSRIAQGKTTLYDHALKGFQGKAGVMPAKGGRPDLPDALVRETVDYLVKAGQ
ncbi:MAG TPA: c-type cytochrome [Steroidobacteraceae bacterium]|nr:c-type cytochrome [Steroidobacteraceae bacterium]